jgi:hypothetical protein
MAVVIPTSRYTNKHDRGINLELAKSSRSWLESRLGPYGKAMFLPFGTQDNNDFETCTLLSSCSSNSEVLRPEQLSILKVLNLISESSIVFPYRLHGLILSYMIGAKYDFYPYHWKLQRAHDTLEGYNPKDIQLKQKTEFNEIIDGPDEIDH